jgi:hypothetical protein
VPVPPELKISIIYPGRAVNFLYFALLRLKQELHQHVFPFSQIPKPKKYRHCASKGKNEYQPYQASIPAFFDPEFADPTVQWLKHKPIEDLSLSSV